VLKHGSLSFEFEVSRTTSVEEINAIIGCNGVEVKW
jgi:hypothetical protein